MVKSPRSKGPGKAGKKPYERSNKESSRGPRRSDSRSADKSSRGPARRERGSFSSYEDNDQEMFARGGKPQKPFQRDAGRDNGRRMDREDKKRRDRPRDKEMFKVTCAACGKKTTVPFKPTSNKPVYCRDCFKTEEKSQEVNMEQELEVINAKLDKILRALDLL